MFTLKSHSLGWYIGSKLRLSVNVIRLFSDNIQKRPNVKTPIGKLDQQAAPQTETESADVYAPFPEGINPQTGEVGGPRGPEPTRYGDWERKGRVSDF